MSDIDDELLGMLEPAGPSKSKSKSSKKPSKRKRPAPVEDDSASDMDMSSDDDAPAPTRKRGKGMMPDHDSSGEDSDDDENPYPLEGKYIDDADRRRILNMSELEREGVLGERQEKRDALEQRKNLRRMVKAKERAEGGASGANDDDGARGRERKTTGTTKEKREGLEKLKKRREEKGKKSERKRSDSPASPRRSRKDDYGAYSDATDSDEEGEVNYESSKSAKQKKTVEYVGPTNFKDILVTRERLARFCNAPWFSEWVTGAWVRYLVGVDDHTRMPVYRLCQVESVRETDREYKFENVTTDLEVELRHGKASKFFSMEGVSNSSFDNKEFARLDQTLQAEDMTLPTVAEVKKIVTNLEKRKEYIMSEADLAARLAKKGGRVNPAQGKAKLLVQREYARSTGDQDLLAEVSAQLAKLEAPPSPSGAESEADRMKRVNERNRANNRDDIKKAEARGQDERRRQAAALARGDDVKVDASARVKTMTRLKYDRDTPSSRPGTPSAITPRPGTPSNGLAEPAKEEIRQPTSKFEELVANTTVDLDLDF